MIPLRCLFSSVKGQRSAMTATSARCNKERRDTQADSVHAQATMTQSPAPSPLPLPLPPPPSAPPCCHSLRGAHPPSQPLSAALSFDTCDELVQSAPLSCTQRRSVFHVFLLILPKRAFRGKTVAQGRLRHSTMGQRSMGNWARQKAI